MLQVFEKDVSHLKKTLANFTNPESSFEFIDTLSNTSNTIFNFFLSISITFSAFYNICLRDSLPTKIRKKIVVKRYDWFWNF